MNLLIQESPLLILPTLAQAIGLDEAILLQQLHFRLTHQSQERDGKLWYCQSYTNWAKQLPFWGESKIKRLFIKLEKDGLIHSTDKYNTFYVDRTKWYSIEYSALDALLHAHAKENGLTTVHTQTLPPSTGEHSDGAQGVRSKRKEFKDVQKERKEKNAQAHPSLFEQPEDQLHTTPQQDASKHTAQIDQIIHYLNTKTSKRFNSKTAATRKLIQARLNDGYTVEDCYQVIDNQVNVWQHDPKMQAYLRPQTLFRASNFESYLNTAVQQQELIFRQPERVELDFDDF